MKNHQPMFWGIIFLVIGGALILRVIFNLDIPIFRLIIAVIFIYLGLKIMFGDYFRGHTESSDENTAIFSERSYQSDQISGKEEYNAVFGKLNLDLRNQQFTEHETRIIVNAVFGGADLHLPANMPVKIKSDVVFGGAQLPEGNSGGFGTYRYKSDDYSDSLQHLYIEIHAVFGGVNVYR